MIYWIVKGISKLPYSVLYGISNVLYWIVARVIGYRKKVVFNNLRASFPEKSEAEIEAIAHEFYRLFCDFIVETIKCLSVTDEELCKRVVFANNEYLRGYMEQGQPIIALIGHQINWEMAWSAASLYAGRPIDGVYKPLKNPAAERLMLELRGKTGGRLIPMKNAVKYMLAKERVTVYGLAGDQTPGRDPKTPSYWTKFLGQDTSFFRGVAWLSTRTGMPVVFFNIEKVKRGYYKVTAIPMATPPYTSKEEDTSIIDRYAQTLEEAIRKHPANWLWSHKRWKYKKPTE